MLEMEATKRKGSPMEGDLDPRRETVYELLRWTNEPFGKGQLFPEVRDWWKYENMKTSMQWLEAETTADVASQNQSNMDNFICLFNMWKGCGTLRQ